MKEGIPSFEGKTFFEERLTAPWGITLVACMKWRVYLALATAGRPPPWEEKEKVFPAGIPCGHDSGERFAAVASTRQTPTSKHVKLQWV